MTFWQWFQSLFSPPAPTPAPKPAPVPHPESAMLDALNSARAANRCVPLMPDAGLDLIAGSRAAKMARTGILSHNGYEHEVADHYPRQATSECIAEGQKTATEVVRDWMNHPHNLEIVLGRFNWVGCGHRDGFWCCDFLSA